MYANPPPSSIQRLLSQVEPLPPQDIQHMLVQLKPVPRSQIPYFMFSNPAPRLPDTLHEQANSTNKEGQAFLNIPKTVVLYPANPEPNKSSQNDVNVGQNHSSYIATPVKPSRKKVKTNVNHSIFPNKYKNKSLREEQAENLTKYFNNILVVCDEGGMKTYQCKLCLVCIFGVKSMCKNVDFNKVGWNLML